jgi:hypothetical protein
MLGSLLVLLAATSSHDSTVPTGYGKPGYDPNKMICVSRDVVGSRLQQVRECHTAQQWVDQDQQERTGMLRQQFNGNPGCNRQGPSVCNPGSSGGRDTPW